MTKKTLVPALAAAALTLLPPALAQAQEAQAPVRSATADLDGDGKKEPLSLEWKNGDAQFVLKAGGATLRGDAKDSEVSGFVIVDLDSGDKWKELAVSTGMTDSDHQVFLYGFDGKSLKPLGSVRNLTEARGNGIILSDEWGGFWTRREKYVLDRKAWKLNAVPQDLYYVGREATVKQSFPLQRNPTSKDVIANVAQGSKIEVLAAAPSTRKGERYWYLVKSTTGLLGWTREEALVQHTEGLPSAG